MLSQWMRKTPLPFLQGIIKFEDKLRQFTNYVIALWFIRTLYPKMKPFTLVVFGHIVELIPDPRLAWFICYPYGFQFACPH
jgi:hypothetical protein